MNRYRRVTAIAVSTLAAGAGMTLPARADTGNTLYVNGRVACGSQQPDLGSVGNPFCSIPAALASDKTGAGTTLMLSGDLPGGVDITKSGITLVDDGTASIVGGAYGVSIAGQHDIRLDGVVFWAQHGTGLRVDHSTGVTVVNGTVTKATGTGVVIQNSSQVTVVDSVVAGNGGGIQITDTTTADVVADTVDANCGTGIAVQGASTDVSIANTIDDEARTCGGTAGTALVVDTSGTAPTIDSDILTTATAGAPAILWQGQPVATGQALDAAGHGTGNLSKPVGFSWPLKPDFTRDAYYLNLTSPAIDSADAGARNQPTVDGAGTARIDDPAVADTGTGSPTYVDRGAFELLRTSSTPSFSFSVTQGQTPTDFRRATASFTAWQDSWWPVTSYTIDWGDHSSSGPLPYTDGTVPTDHTYKADGDYNGSVTVTNSGGHKFSREFGLHVEERHFTPTMSAIVRAGNADWAGSVDVTLAAPLGDPITGYRIDYGDGSAAEVPPSPPWTSFVQLHHSYKQTGTYQITATVTDQNGWSRTLSQQVVVSPPPSPGPTTTPIVHRIGGLDRYDTARQVSQAQWKPGSASAVVLARGDQAPDALAGVPLTAHVHGPLLLTDPAALDTATRAEIDRVTGGPSASKTVYILGGDKAVSPAVEAGLRKAGYTVVRYQGADRFGTSLAVAGAFGRTDHVIVATGRDFPDALAAGPLGAVEKAPIVLSDGDALTPAVASFVTAHQAIDPVGGAAQRAVNKLPGVGGHSVNGQLAGATRYETAAAVARAVVQVLGHAPAGAGIASGTAFPDALTGGAYAANAGMPLLITEPAGLSGATGTWLSQWANLLPAVTVFGGPNAIPAGVVYQIAGAVNGTVR